MSETTEKALVARHREIDGEVSRLRTEQAEIARAIDALRLEGRPAFPTDEQKTGIKEAARRIHAKEKASDHLGDPTPTYAVVVDGKNAWLHIRHASPYKTSGASWLWDFTDDEIRAFIDLLAAEGLSIANWWRSERGVSFRTHPTPKEV